jgi:hypothetical protein
MKVSVQEAKPILSFKSNKSAREYYVKYWEVTGYVWDGDCMCTRKDFNLHLKYSELSFPINLLNTLILMEVKKAI